MRNWNSAGREVTYETSWRARVLATLYSEFLPRHASSQSLRVVACSVRRWLKLRSRQTYGEPSARLCWMLRRGAKRLLVLSMTVCKRRLMSTHAFLFATNSSASTVASEGIFFLNAA